MMRASRHEYCSLFIQESFQPTFEVISISLSVRPLGEGRRGAYFKKQPKIASRIAQSHSHNKGVTTSTTLGL